jgi:di/tricarboxylate transporter
MIGTAPCLIVQGLLIQKGLQQFSFFDPGLVTSAAAIIVVFYLTFISPLILPKDQPNLLEAVETQTRDIVTEIEFTEESVFTGKLLDVSVRKLGLQSSHVVKLRRKTESPFLPQEKSDEETYPPVSSEQELKEIAEANSEKFFEIFPVPLDIEIQAGDVLVLSGPPSELFPWANRKISVGLKVLNLNAKELAGSGTEFFEVVISRHCPFSGKSFSSEYFSRYYACRTVALRKRNSSGFLGASKFVNSQVTLQFGDSVLVLARPDFFKRWRLHSHFLLVIHKGNLPPKVTWFDYVPLVLFCGMLLFSSLHDYPLVKIATILAAFFFLGRWVNVKDLPQIADWNLLLMLSCALGFSTSIYSSGLDNDVAVLIQSASLGSYGR